MRGHRTFPLRPSKPSNSSDGLKKPPRSIPQDPVFKKNEPCEQLDLKFKLNFDIVCYFVLLKRNP